MPAHRDTVRTWLEESGHSVVEGPEGALVFTLEGDPPLLVAGLVSEDGTMFQLRTVGLFRDGDRDNTLAVQSLLLDLNRRYKMVKFVYDPTDGEVVAWVDVYLGQGELTSVQVDRCLTTLSTVALPQRDRIRTMATTGEDTGEASPSPVPSPLINFRGEAGEA